MPKALNTVITIGAAFILSGCVNAVQQVQKTADKQAYAAAETSSRACPAPGDLGSQYDATVDGSAFNDALFDEAVLHYTNERRCAKGLSPLASDNGLSRAASGHSTDMASMKFFSHTSPVPGKSSLQNRLDASNVNYSAAAENLAQRSRLQMQSGRPFTVLDRASCQFAYDGQVIQPHSYRSLAQEFVRIWEASPQHSANMFNSNYTRLGNGGSFSPKAENCGDIVATQNYAA